MNQSIEKNKVCGSKFTYKRNMLIILCIGLLLFKLYSMKEMNFFEIINMSSDPNEYETLLIIQRDGNLNSKRTDRTDIMEDFFKHMEEYSFRRSFKRGRFRGGPQTYSIQLVPKIEKNNYTVNVVIVY